MIANYEEYFPRIAIIQQISLKKKDGHLDGNNTNGIFVKLIFKKYNAPNVDGNNLQRNK